MSDANDNQPIAAVDKTEGHVITCTVRKDYVGTTISGCLVQVEAGGDVTLLQAGSVTTTNNAHEDPQLRHLVADRGHVPHHSETGDIERVELHQLANYRKDTDQIGPARRNPSSGAPVHHVSDLTPWERETEYKAILGLTTGGRGVPVSVVNRNFGRQSKDEGNDNGGLNEALHEAWFGQNGSAKTIGAVSRFCLRLAQNPDMGAILIDVKGDLQDDEKFKGRGGFEFRPHEFLNDAGREVVVVPLAEIAIESGRFLMDVLAGWLKQVISTTADKASSIVSRALDRLDIDDTGESLVRVNDGMISDIVSTLISILPTQFSAKSAGQEKADILASKPEKHAKDLAKKLQVMLGSKPINGIVDMAFNEHRIVVIDVNIGSQRKDVLAEIVNSIKNRAKHYYKTRSMLANVSVYLDEGHNWIPEGESDRLSNGIATCLRETRAYGVGWIIVSQSMADISKDVLKQSHTIYFGRNLGVGADRKHLETALGKHIGQYDMLSASGRFFFMAKGRDVNIGGDNAVLDFFTFDGDLNEQLKKHNPHIFGGKGGDA